MSKDPGLKKSSLRSMKRRKCVKGLPCDFKYFFGLFCLDVNVYDKSNHYYLYFVYAQQLGCMLAGQHHK